MDLYDMLCYILVDRIYPFENAADGVPQGSVEDDEASSSEDEGVEADLSDDEDLDSLKLLWRLLDVHLDNLRCSRNKSSWQPPCDAGVEMPRSSDNQCDNQFAEDKRMDQTTSDSNRLSPEVEMTEDACPWSAGWDACTNEALRYLVQVEGLSVCHPTVLAMKNYLQIQKNRLMSDT